MENATFIKAYLITFIICTILTIALILLINKYVDWSIEKSYLDESVMETDSDK